VIGRTHDLWIATHAVLRRAFCLIGAILLAVGCGGREIPNPAQRTIMYYDSDSGSVMLYMTGVGLETEGTSSLYRWEENTWNLVIAPRILPSGQKACVYDSAHARLVIICQHDRSTWMYGSSGWTRARLKTETPAISTMCAFYDPSRKEVQVGGGEGLFALRGDSWIQMEGWSWPVEIAYQPPVYEPQGKRILVYGGSSKNAPGACLYEVTPDRTRELFPQQFGDWGSEDVFSDRPIAANRLEGMVYDSTRSRLIFVGTDRHTRQFGIYGWPTRSFGPYAPRMCPNRAWMLCIRMIRLLIQSSCMVEACPGLSGHVSSPKPGRSSTSLRKMRMSGAG